ncbi:TPA_asm: maturation protein [ssRNA phage SRR7976310_14]|uniref:Maturation protein n=1 Tax=ssRNA phage SRR7976310_14 TaxID=2786676 RepID=A0A8S5L5V0_9VIRU|nr:maturation protein [ssRNA phage SRR7976310_14]DAD52714.1 TPA_asm: maturation protein [ssRNA phage SRR7976310_14]
MRKTSIARTYLSTPFVRCDMVLRNGSRTSTSNPGFSVVHSIGTTSDISSGSSKTGAFTECVHTSVNYAIIEDPAKFVLKHDASTNAVYASGQCFGGVSDVINRYYSARFATPVATTRINTFNRVTNWGSLYAQSMAAMLPTFDGGDNSLVNFVLELKDFKRLGASLVDRSKTALAKLGDAIGYHPKNKPIRNLSEAYLGYQFAWKPLVKDVISLYQSISSFNERLNDTIARAGKPQQRYYGFFVAGTAVNESFSTITSDNPSLPGTGWKVPAVSVRTRYHSSPGVRYHATMRYRYSLPPELRTAKGKLKALLDVLGVNSNPAILWNAIPFTFILDWVFNVGKFLDQFKVTNVTFQTEILDFCHSVKEERRVSYECNWWHKIGTTEIPSGYRPIHQATIKTYVRKTELMPGFAVALQTSGLSPREVSLAGALIGARTPRKRR